MAKFGCIVDVDYYCDNCKTSHKIKNRVLAFNDKRWELDENNEFPYEILDIEFIKIPIFNACKCSAEYAAYIYPQRLQEQLYYVLYGELKAGRFKLRFKDFIFIPNGGFLTHFTLNGEDKVEYIE